MIGATDYAGIAAVITSVFGGIIGIITLWRTTQVHTEVKNPNGTTTGNSIESIRQTVNAPEQPTLPAPPSPPTPPPQ